MIYHFYQKEWKLKNAEKLLTKTEYVLLITNLKQALNQGFVLKRVKSFKSF